MSGELVVGCRVRIVNGPYAGKSGVLTSILPRATDGLTHGVEKAEQGFGIYAGFPQVYHGIACRPEDLEVLP